MLITLLILFFFFSSRRRDTRSYGDCSSDVCSSDLSKVILLSDEISSVASCIPVKSLEGLIEGQGTGLLKLNYLPMESQVAAGDLVFTSNTSVTFPADILIGTISKTLPQDPFLTFQA